MADPRFFKKKGPFTLAELAEIGGCVAIKGDPLIAIDDIAHLESAGSTQLSLFSHPRYSEAVATTKAAACIISPELKGKAPSHLALLVTKHPSRSYALIANAFYPPEAPVDDIAPTAIVHPTARLGKGVTVGAYTVIKENVEIGDYVHIDSFVTVGQGVVIGESSVIETQVSLSHALLGKRVHIKPGARIGQNGFGFFMDDGDMGGHVPVPQLGRVIIHDSVEIGSNTTIDRGAVADTIIGEGTRIDNLVQIAHNVHLGKGCVIVAQVGISGSTKFGDYVAAGGQAGITGHLKIGNYARIAAQSGIMRDVNPGEILCGSPAMPIKTHYRQVSVLKKLEENTRKKRN